jgi:hypothetical protein
MNPKRPQAVKGWGPKPVTKVGGTCTGTSGQTYTVSGSANSTYTVVGTWMGGTWITNSASGSSANGTWVADSPMPVGNWSGVCKGRIGIG